METPNNEAGRQTENIMLEFSSLTVSGKPVSSSTYNRCYEAVYALLCEIMEIK